MATGGYDRSLDNRVTCSICLEPYKGRQPKLLPCFHTFCLPCLTQLTKKNDSQPTDGAGVDDGAAATLRCPTCRTLIPLPPAGVSGLQNNVYVDDSGDHNPEPRPLNCDLCEEGQSAKLSCSTCKTYFCTRCRRTHDKLCKFGQVLEIKVQPAAFGQASMESDAKDVKSLAAAFSQLMDKHMSLEKLVTILQNQNTLLCRDLSSLHEKNGRQENEIAAAKKNFDALQREVVSLKDKSAILCQDNQVLHNNVTKLQDGVSTLQGEMDKQQGELSQLKTQASPIQVQGDTTSLKNNQGDIASLKTEQSKLQVAFDNTIATQSTLRDDMKKMKSDQGRMQSNLDKTRNKLQADLKKITTQVAFHARLTNAVQSVKKNDVLICDDVLTNVGNAYDNATGIFTVPVSGIYCFVACGSPHSQKANDFCNAFIVVDSTELAYLLSFGKGNSTAHVSTSLKAGQKVCLKHSENGAKIHGGWITSFTGFLVQADL